MGEDTICQLNKQPEAVVFAEFNVEKLWVVNASLLDSTGNGLVVLFLFEDLQVNIVNFWGAYF